MSTIIINPFIFDSVVPSTYLVDLYSPVAAYSVNKISSTATLCCRVRRASDNAEQDIGFVGDVIDTTAIETFVGVGNDAFITAIYNQGTVTGSTYDLYDTIPTNQGRVFYSVASPYFSTEKSAGVYGNGIPVNNNIPLYKTAFAVSKTDVSGIVPYIIYDVGKGLRTDGTAAGVDGLGGYDGTNSGNLNNAEDLLEHISYWNMRSAKLFVANDGGVETDIGTFAASLKVTYIAGGSGSTLAFKGYFKEIVIFDVDESSNRVAIRDNQNSRFSTF